MHYSASLLRQQHLSRRLQIPLAQQLLHAKQVCQRITQSQLLRPPLKVALYRAVKGEIDLSPLARYCWSHGISCYLPICHPILAGRLWFAPFTAETVMKKNRYGIEEPWYTKATILASWELDIIFMPLVAFDWQGHRLGMGKGYYDRSLAFRRLTSLPYLIGCSHSCQYTPHICPQPWDISLDAIVTESTMHFIHPYPNKKYV